MGRCHIGVEAHLNMSVVSVLKLVRSRRSLKLSTRGQVRPVQGLALSRVNDSRCDGVGQQSRQVGRVGQDAIGDRLQILIKWNGVGERGCTCCPVV